MKNRILKFISEYSSYLLYLIGWVILTVIIIKVSLYFYQPMDYIIYITFVVSIDTFLMMILYQISLIELLYKLNYVLGYKIYEWFKIEEKTLEELKNERKLSSLKIEINKKQKDEISPMRGIIIKRLENE